ncbi:hypothetical protein FE257_010766 [Aspergillus nanangensis]|uniref:Carrier domain-containing protein n=1 Tax=Aspergillus nanangensis TaxID=2582783 RepID=A0AAD4CVF9_ASPNN|nr:hypothetical protein FE257_010766 [Aspergillus nanangensis]
MSDQAQSEELWRRHFQDLSASPFPEVASKAYKPKPTGRVHHYISFGNDGSRPIQTALVAAWGIVVAYYTGNDDVVFRLARDIGCSGSCEESPLPLRLQLNPETTISRTIEYTDSRLVEWASMSASLLGHPKSQGHDIARAGTCQNTLQFRHDREGACRKVAAVNDDGSSHSESALTIICDLGEHRGHIEALFDPAVVSPDAAQMMLYQLAHTFGAVCQANARQTIVADIMTSSHQVVNHAVWRSFTPPPPATHACVHDRIAEHCRSRPDTLAVDAWDGRLTYRELEEVASGLSARLAGINQRHDIPVGCVLMERSVWVSISILGLMKAGISFLLLDPSLPLARLKLICAKSNAAVVVSSVRHVDLAQSLGPPVVEVSDRARLADGGRQAAHSPSADVLPRDICNCLFTSGSTGEPKVTLIEHAAVYTAWTSSRSDQINLGSSSRVFQYASPAFGVSVIDYLGTLMSGGCLCVPSDEQLENDLAGAIRKSNANSIAMTPSAARCLDPDSVPSLKTMILAGEPLSTTDLQRWQGRVDLFSMYGQSEVAAFSFASPKTGPSCLPRDLGRVRDPWRAWIVDANNHNHLMPLGAVGELLLEGPCLGRGYLNDPEQTKEKYITAPVWLKRIRPEISPSHRLLKTGDLVRSTATGTIEYVGRRGSSQVKLRGQRMDLMEVEHHLRELYSAASNVVADILVPPDTLTNDSAMLVGFVVMKSAPRAHGKSDDLILGTPTVDTRQHAQLVISQMKQLLPSYMVPTSIVTAEHIPLTTTGKIHRQRLHSLASALSRDQLLTYIHERAPGKPITVPTTPAETVIQQICAEALGVPPVKLDIGEGFSALGGDSLAARRIVTLCRQTGVSITVSDLFSSPSLKSLAAENERVNLPKGTIRPATEDPFALLQRDFRRSMPMCTQGLVVEDVYPLQAVQWREMKEVSYFVFRISGPLEVERLRHACEALTRTHTALRSMVVPFGQELVNVVLEKHPCPFAQQHLPEGTSLVEWGESFSQADLHRSHPTSEPVTRFILGTTDTDAAQAVLIMRLPHVHFDGDCLLQIYTDLWTLYENKPVTVTSSYGDFARAVFQRLQGPSTAAYWRGLLTNSEPPSIPARRLCPGESVQTLSGARRIVLTNPPNVGVTMAIVVKTAWAYLVHRWTGQNTVVLTQTVNGRDVVATEGTEMVIGPCHSIFPLCARFSPAITTRQQLLDQMQEQFLASLRYGVIDWRDLAKFTTWPTDSTFGYVLAYQDFPMPGDLQVGALSTECTWCHVASVQPGEAFVSAVPVDGGLELTLNTLSTSMDQDEVDRCLREFGKTVTDFLYHPHLPL